MLKVTAIGDPLLSGKKIKQAVHIAWGSNIEVTETDWIPVSSQDFRYFRSVIERKKAPLGRLATSPHRLGLDVNMIIAHYAPLNYDIFAHAKQCIIVGICRAALDNIDLQAASRNNIAVFHMPDKIGPPEYAARLLLREIKRTFLQGSPQWVVNLSEIRFAFKDLR